MAVIKLTKSCSTFDFLPQTGSDEQAQTVLLVYPEGCECIEQFVVLLGNFIHNIGIRCILDVVKETEVAKHGGRDLFIMDYLIEANYIIFINYKGRPFWFCLLVVENHLATNVFECILLQIRYVSGLSLAVSSFLLLGQNFMGMSYNRKELIRIFFIFSKLSFL